ncbi:MAG: DNA-binding protein [Mesorhizobium sp.]|uniref:DNA-binding protein n=1 Tax=unclassified Mesorhizobium TaxID=325217 RepID=UPI000FCA7011|nr:MULTISPECIES: DNA-binding protein [unclassified Mesorhizobium]RUU26693.1 DNA-binding protein [Mesorhizobium sp. M6A.T.Ce.TU.016.01.1.1]RWN29282.1 MAG: DNA-binding protein [Mesorhizobium sp.]RWN66662.1 MAG: DNA-binding protein [Mesorhizobium sp.]RWQ62381.1 MAG: DNA-binding protein [Mesorhizobium sp.]RWQ70451.1 MAG: DNA-binding protein [Mesorhizobium sp.]
MQHKNSEKSEAKDRQYQKFVEKARELETDESEENFDRVLKKVVKSPLPKDSDKKATK